MRGGVTKAAVSFALNGQPGVSAATRERILAITEEIGFQPSSAARTRRRWQQRRVDGVFVVDLKVYDRRVGVLEELRM